LTLFAFNVLRVPFGNFIMNLVIGLQLSRIDVFILNLVLPQVLFSISQNVLMFIHCHLLSVVAKINGVVFLSEGYNIVS
jgi:hypothetical protein